MFLIVIYICGVQQALLQSSVSHDPLEIIVIWCSRKFIIIIITWHYVENSIA